MNNLRTFTLLLHYSFVRSHNGTCRLSPLVLHLIYIEGTLASGCTNGARKTSRKRDRKVWRLGNRTQINTRGTFASLSAVSAGFHARCSPLASPFLQSNRKT